MIGKKTAALLLCMTVLLSILSGCGRQADVKENTEPENCSGIDLTESVLDDAVTQVSRISYDAKCGEKYFRICGMMTVGEHVIVEYALSDEQIAGLERYDDPPEQTYLGVLNMEGRDLDNTILVDMEYTESVNPSLTANGSILWYSRSENDGSGVSFTAYDENLAECGSFSCTEVGGYFSSDNDRYYYVSDGQVVWISTDGSGESGTLESFADFVPESLTGHMTLGDGHDGLCLSGKGPDLNTYTVVADVQENRIVYWQDGTFYGYASEDYFWIGDYGDSYSFRVTDFENGWFISYSEGYYPGLMRCGELLLSACDVSGEDGTSAEQLLFIDPAAQSALGSVTLEPGLESDSYVYLGFMNVLPGTELCLADIETAGTGETWYLIDLSELDPDNVPDDGLSPVIDSWIPEADEPEFSSEYDPADYTAGLCLDSLSDCREYADELEEKYGVGIYISDECRMVWGNYAVGAMNDHDLVMDSLTGLDEELAKYPEGFLDQVSWGPVSGIDFYLAGTIFSISAEEDSLSTAGGFQDQGFGRDMIVISIDEFTGLQRSTVHHELSHAIDSMLDACTQGHGYIDADEWNSLNPEGFAYTESYKSWEDGTMENMDAWTQWNAPDDSVYFIDSYSKTRATEDRARIFEYVMVDSDYSAYPGIIAKLNYYASKIREAFDTEGWNDVPWEKYF